MIKAIIFDKDGTLHDTEKVFAVAWRLAADEFHVPDIESTIRDCTGRTVPDIGVYFAKKYPSVPYDDYMACRHRHLHRLLEANVPVKEGAYELLEYLRAQGYRIGLATSTGRKTAMDHLIRTNMVDCFDPEAIITGDMVKNGKPAPDIFRLAAERLGVDPGECIGVEDSFNGIRAIHAAGMRPIMVPDLLQPTPEIEALVWRTCTSLCDVVTVLENMQPI